MCLERRGGRSIGGRRDEGEEPTARRNASEKAARPDPTAETLKPSGNSDNPAPSSRPSEAAQHPANELSCEGERATFAQEIAGSNPARVLENDLEIARWRRGRRSSWCPASIARGGCHSEKSSNLGSQLVSIGSAYQLLQAAHSTSKTMKPLDQVRSIGPPNPPTSLQEPAASTPQRGPVSRSSHVLRYTPKGPCTPRASRDAAAGPTAVLTCLRRLDCEG